MIDTWFVHGYVCTMHTATQTMIDAWFVHGNVCVYNGYCKDSVPRSSFHIEMENTAIWWGVENGSTLFDTTSWFGHSLPCWFIAKHSNWRTVP